MTILALAGAGPAVGLRMPRLTAPRLAAGPGGLRCSDGSDGTRHAAPAGPASHPAGRAAVTVCIDRYPARRGRHVTAEHRLGRSRVTLPGGAGLGLSIRSSS
jgi:hypothetical protein